MKHTVEVDQSIKIEQLGDTVLAFSNGISHAIIVPARVKREALSVLWTILRTVFKTDLFVVKMPEISLGYCHYERQFG